jgi:GAF domain-containing protein
VARGYPETLDAAASVHAELGSNWSELSIGTNAMGTALAERHPLQVFCTEPFTETVHGWACSAAPVHHPRTGQVLGVVNLTGPLRTLHPHALSLVVAAVRVLETHIGAADPRGTPAGGALQLLSGERAVLQTRSESLPLSLRHAEILTLLAYRPEGWTAEQLALELHGDFRKPVSVRVELSRLRQGLGPVIDAEPYRLADGIRVDFRELEALLAADRIHAALDLYHGPLLPGSDVPLINELRDRIDEQLRARVLESHEPAVFERWLRTLAGHDDGEAIARLLALAGDRATTARYRGRLERLERLGLVDVTRLLPPRQLASPTH